MKYICIELRYIIICMKVYMLRQQLFWNPRIRSEDGMMLGQKKYLPWGKMLGLKVRSVRDWEVFSMKMQEGQAGSSRFKRTTGEGDPVDR